MSKAQEAKLCESHIAASARVARDKTSHWTSPAKNAKNRPAFLCIYILGVFRNAEVPEPPGNVQNCLNY
jgi:hypothetical protein